MDSSESCKRVKDSVFSYEGSSLSVEPPSRSYSVTECINDLKTMGLDHNFYVDAVSHLLKNVYHRVEFLATSEKFMKGLLSHYIDKANENDPSVETPFCTTNDPKSLLSR